MRKGPFAKKGSRKTKGKGRLKISMYDAVGGA